MSKKGWRIINAVEAAIQGHSPNPEPELTPEEIETKRQARLLEEYDKEKRVPPPSKPFVPFGDIFAQALKKH